MDPSGTWYFARCTSQDGTLIMTELVTSDKIFKTSAQPNKKPQFDLKSDNHFRGGNPNEVGNLNLINHMSESIVEKSIIINTLS